MPHCRSRRGWARQGSSLRTSPQTSSAPRCRSPGGHLCLQLVDHARRIRAADVVALQQHLPASATAHQLVAQAVEARLPRAQHHNSDHAQQSELHRPRPEHRTTREPRAPKLFASTHGAPSPHHSSRPVPHDGILLPQPRRRADKIRHQRNECPQHHNHHANPYPRDQRIQKHLDDWSAAVRVPSLEDGVEVGLGGRVQRHDRRCLFVVGARKVRPLLRRKLCDVLAILIHIEPRVVGVVLRLGVLRIAHVDQPVWPDRERIAVAHLHLARLVERPARDADEHAPRFRSG